MVSDLECNSGLKYKVGDEVVVVSNDFKNVKDMIGFVGKVLEANENSTKFHYSVGNGEEEYWFAESELELVQDGDTYIENKSNKVKSSGGSSSYYFSKLPKEVIEDIVDKGGIELKDVVKYCFYNDADVKDITKAIKRIMEDLRGGGKDGIDAQYDLNKIEFFFEEFKKSVLIQKREQELSYDR